MNMDMVYSNGLDERKTKIMILNIIEMEEDNRLMNRNNEIMETAIADMIKKEVEKR